MAAVFQLHATVGFLPPPAMLEQYERLRPGFTGELMEMAKTQAGHRQYLERLNVEGNSKRADRGQWLAGGSMAVIFGAAIALAFTGRTAVAIAFVAIDVVGVAGVFISGRVEQRRERLEKQRLMNQVDPGRKLGVDGPGS